MAVNKGKIFLIDEAGRDVKEMQESQYSAEDILQRLLVLKPDLIPGDQIAPQRPCKWILLKREMGVPDGTSNTDRWSIDHLFLDQDGIPTFVECKRASDSRNRREVVAQMLDYAANALAYWKMDHLRQIAAGGARNGTRSFNDELAELLGSSSEVEIENFWKLVESNLRDGKVRLIFVSDEIPRELRRLVEFLNEKMSDVEVLAVEIKQFLGDNVRALVPRVIGNTEKARDIKGIAVRKNPLTEEELLAGCSPDAAALFRHVLASATEKGLSIYWGNTSVSIRAHVQQEDREYASFLYAYPPNAIEFYLKQLKLPDTESAIFRQELLNSGIFQEAGNWTLRAFITPEDAQKINAVVLAGIERVTKLQASYHKSKLKT